ncbi:IS481 family transposase [Azospirillum brasilense]|uniref:IS481 family transposase n=1 Tax=Azospirillum brasilense TaxID=192 RepID=A0A4D8QX38_AZOBR|nr:IS481 family transposase [Azospirillum brasilense]QCO14191.1 IS481 family transposase [Azospirillum brasilense]
MDIHKNAALTPRGREIAVRRVLEGGETRSSVATELRVSPGTISKWCRRYKAEGVAGLHDRSSRPKRSPRQTAAATAERVIALRRQRFTYGRITAELGVSAATVSRILRTAGLNRLKALDPPEPVRRYERERPGEMLHIDIKKLGRIGTIGHRITGDASRRARGVGWEYVHVCIDDASRVAFCQIHADERQHTAVLFLEVALAYYASLGITVERVMTDNGGCYRSKAFRTACKRLGVKHIFTKPYTPQTNGKAERFIQTALREWAYAHTYEHSDQRGAKLPLWLHAYNWHRPHASLGKKTPISRIGLPMNNLLTLHS